MNTNLVFWNFHAFEKVKHQIVPQTKARHFFDCLEICRDKIKSNAPILY